MPLEDTEEVLSASMKATIEIQSLDFFLWSFSGTEKYQSPGL